MVQLWSCVLLETLEGSDTRPWDFEKSNVHFRIDITDRTGIHMGG